VKYWAEPIPTLDQPKVKYLAEQISPLDQQKVKYLAEQISPNGTKYDRQIMETHKASSGEICSAKYFTFGWSSVGIGSAQCFTSGRFSGEICSV
jgi:hypothetical protein